MSYDNGLQIISQCDSNELATLTAVEDKSNGELIVEYTAPYQRLEIYCSFFQVNILNVIYIHFDLEKIFIMYM